MSKKIITALRAAYGTRPKAHYYSFDMESYRSYYEYRYDNKKEEFLLDSITSHDLDLEKLFKEINLKTSTVGSQYLYYMLHSPQVSKEGYLRRKKVLDYFSNHEEDRFKVWAETRKLGNTRNADASALFNPRTQVKSYLLPLILMYLLLIGSIILGIFRNPIYLVFTWSILGMNAMAHWFLRKKFDTHIDETIYSISMIHRLKRIKAFNILAIEDSLKESFKALKKLGNLSLLRFVALMASNPFDEMLNHLLLLDFLTYELVKKKLSTYPQEIFEIHEGLGLLDANFSILSYRASLPFYTEGDMDFNIDRSYLDVLGLVHPLLEEAIENDVHFKSPILITGSNASGKSTYLKATLLSAIMAQSVMTVTAESYKGCLMYPYTSMALSDDLLKGDSYYVAETKSLKRLFNALERGEKVLCAVDEVLRGTNTVERIAASTEILKLLAQKGALVMVATHDIELTDTLKDYYQFKHFREHMEGESITFDYKVYEGKATTRNAINLLNLLGFDKELVKASHKRADHFMKTNTWH